MIEKITLDEFKTATKSTQGRHGKGSRLSPEMAAARAMVVGEAIKFPCRWNHSKTDFATRCNGTMMMLQGLKNYGYQVQAKCRDKVVFVNRWA